MKNADVLWASKQFALDTMNKRIIHAKEVVESTRLGDPTTAFKPRARRRDPTFAWKSSELWGRENLSIGYHQINPPS
jgi:hypothetical protein